VLSPPPPPAAPIPVADLAWHRQPQVRLAPGDPPRFLVRCGDYVSPILITDDPWKLPMSDRIELAFRSLPGGAGEPATVGHENITGLMEDHFVWHEWTVAATPAAVVALHAVVLTWDVDAANLAGRFQVSADAVEAVRADMRREARDRFLEHESFTARIRQRRTPDAPAPDSADSGDG
jgi:hypothetical protein